MSDEREPATREPADRAVVAVDGREAMRQAIIDVVTSARRSLLVMSGCLESGLYGDPAVVEAFRQQLLEQRRLKVKLIVSDPTQAGREAEALIELSRRLTSQFEFREPVNSKWEFETEFLVADRKCWFHRISRTSRVAKFAALDAPGAVPLLKVFDETWLNSQPAQEFRRLGI